MTAAAVFRPKHVSSIKFGSTDFSTINFSSTTVALDTSFSTNNSGTASSGTAVPGTVLLNLVGAQTHTGGTATAAYSEAFAKDITYSGNERSVTEENLLGSDTGGAQNQETNVDPTSLLEVTMTIVYRNPVPTSIFNDRTKCCLMEMDNEETASSGLANFAFKEITVLTVGALTMNSEGMMEQTVKFSCKGGTTGISIIVETVTETWYKVTGGDYAEEIRTK